MTSYAERNSLTLLTGAADPDGDMLTLRRINGEVILSWPHVMEMGKGSVSISEGGTVIYDDGGSITEHPTTGASIANGFFTYTVWDGQDESGLQTANITLYGATVAPSRIIASETRPLDDLAPGATMATLSAIGTAPFTFSLVDLGGMPIEVSSNRIVTTGPLSVGSYDVQIECQNALGPGAALTQTIRFEVRDADTAIFYGQHTPAQRPGPNGGEGSYTTTDGVDLAPSGSGDWRFVDAGATGTADGSTLANAHRTIGAAVTASDPGDVILVEAGNYPERINLAFGTVYGTAADPLRICRRGSGRVVIDGGDLATGIASAVSGDAKNNSNWASLKKFTVSSPDIDPSGWALRQGETFLTPVITGKYADTAEMFFIGDDRKYFTTSNTADLTDGQSGFDISLTSATIFGGYASGDLDSASAVYMYAPGNNVETLPITFNAATDTATVTTAVSGRSYNGGFAIVNSVKDISAAGQWGYTDDGGGNFTIYFWPVSADLTNVRYSTRTRGLQGELSDHITLYGVDIVGQGGINQNEGQCLLFFDTNTSDSNASDGLKAIECRFGHAANRDGWGRPLNVTSLQNAEIRNCTVEYAWNSGGIATSNCDRLNASYNKIDHIGRNGWGWARSFECICAYNSFTNIESIHGNGMSCYLECNFMLFWGNYFDTGYGVSFTRQESANIWIGFCVAILSETLGRGIEDNGTQVAEHPAGNFLTDGTVSVINSTVAPWRSAPNPAPSSTNGINFGTTTGNTHNALNNVTAGGIGRAEISPGVFAEFSTFQALKGTVTGNYNMALGSVPSKAHAYFVADGNFFDDDIADYFVDYTAGNLTPKLGGAIAGNGLDASAHLPTGAWVTGFDMARDADGVSFDWATNPPIGAYLGG